MNRPRSTDALFGPDLDVRVRAARLAAILYLLGGTTLLASARFLPADVDVTGVYGVAALALGTAGPLVLLPWHRFPAWTIALPLIWGVTMISLVGVCSGGLAHFALFYGLASLYVGLTLPTGSWRWVAPLYALSIVGAMLGRESTSSTVDLLGATALAAVVGEVLAGAIGRTRRAMVGTEDLLRGVTQMHSADSESSAAAIVAALGQSLLGSDGSIVMVATKPGSPLFVNSGQAGVEPPLGALVIDSTSRSGIRLAIQEGRALFVADAHLSPVLAQSVVAKLGFASVLFVPIPGEGSFLGCLVLGWRERKSGLEEFEQNVLSLLSEQAGQLLERLRRVGALRTEARTDALTGLANRRVFLEALDRLRPGAAVVFLDLDHFKQLNDSQGHQAGDEALVGFAAALRSCVRDGDCAARYGGEEFALVLPSAASVDMGPAAAVVVARLREAWAGPVTFSVGIAVHRAGDAPSTTLARADAALYEAKAAGRNTLVVA